MTRAVIIAAIALAMAGCEQGGKQGGGTAGSAVGGVAVVCSQSKPGSLNPFSSSDQISSDLRLLLYTPLVLYDSAGFRPYLATHWSWSDDHRTLKLALRSDVVWHDGTPVTARDVAWTLRAAADTAYAYWNGSDVAGIDSVAAPDSATVIVHFRQPSTAGLEPFTTLPILPRHLLDTVPATQFARAPYNRAPVGSGPFRFAGRLPNGDIRFQRFDRFPAALGRPALDAIVFTVVPEPSTAVIDLRTGTADLCIVGPSLAKDVESAPELHALSVPPAGIDVAMLDERKPPFNDVQVRRAFSAATDRTALAGLVSPLARPARTFLPESSPYIDPSLGEPDADSAFAAAELDSAGWRLSGADPVRRNAAGQPLQAELAGPQSFQTVLTAMQAELARVGFDAKVHLMEGLAFFSEIVDPARRPPVMILALAPSRVVYPDPYPELHTNGDTNLSGYSNPTVDSLVQQLRLPQTDAGRKQLFTLLQRYVARDVPNVYMVYVPRLLAVGPRIHGVTVDLNGPFASVLDWTRGGASTAGRQ